MSERMDAALASQDGWAKWAILGTPMALVPVVHAGLLEPWQALVLIGATLALLTAAPWPRARPRAQQKRSS